LYDLNQIHIDCTVYGEVGLSQIIMYKIYQ